MINVIIFSKDRACQLDLLLRSLEKHYRANSHFNVLYHFSSPDFGAGYNRLRQQFTFCNFHIEKNFKKDIVRLTQSGSNYTIFLTDDDVFINDFDTDLLFKRFDRRIRLKGDVASLSLRLGRNITYCYMRDKKEKVPLLMKLANIWKWRKCSYDWGYPMSIDGNIFLTKDIMPLIESKEYSNPNEMESVFSQDPIDKPVMMCYHRPKLINLAMNRVQGTFASRCGSVGIEYLNNRYLKGERIALEPVEKFSRTTDACHVEYEPVF